MMFTEEIGLLMTLAKWPSGIQRSLLVRTARTYNRLDLGMENDATVTNATIESLIAQNLAAKGRQGKYFLTLEGARALTTLQKRISTVDRELRRLGGFYNISEATTGVRA